MRKIKFERIIVKNKYQSNSKQTVPPVIVITLNRKNNCNNTTKPKFALFPCKFDNKLLREPTCQIKS